MKAQTIRSAALAVHDLAKALSALFATIAEFLMEMFGTMPRAGAT